MHRKRTQRIEDLEVGIFGSKGENHPIFGTQTSVVLQHHHCLNGASSVPVYPQNQQPKKPMSGLELPEKLPILMYFAHQFLKMTTIRPQVLSSFFASDHWLQLQQGWQCESHEVHTLGMKLLVKLRILHFNGGTSLVWREINHYVLNSRQKEYITRTGPLQYRLEQKMTLCIAKAKRTTNCGTKRR